MKFCSLYSGSSGNSIFIAGDQGKILIDAGMPGKYIEASLKEIGESPKFIDGIFITHEHSDHIKGVGVLSRKYNIPIYATEKTWLEMEGRIGNIKEESVRRFNGNSIDIKDITVNRFSTPHDAIDSSGYTVHHKDKKCAVVTDIGHFSYEIKDAIRNSDVILLESNHDVEMVKFGPYPYNLKRRILSSVGHLSNEDCGKAIIDILDGKEKTIFLGHLSNNNNYPDLAYETVKSILVEAKVDLEKEVKLYLAKREGPSEVIEI
ncbi:MBL fold metallo-hydrolase [uncultured Clostridium sp.]|uniref:MBL fold metallo-hydrolase n=1 Tax=uncultured Clostridium sp. TaxID=59620 RepID=UPI0025F48F95|nr:MBL fold metallo-hydrolase [uncultured Clostridium sp.]